MILHFEDPVSVSFSNIQYVDISIHVNLFPSLFIVVVETLNFSHISTFADESLDDFEHSMSPDGPRSVITQPSSATATGTASSSSFELPSDFSTDRPTLHKRNQLPESRTAFGSRIPARTPVIPTNIDPPSTSLSTTSASLLTSSSSAIPTSVGNYEVTPNSTSEMHGSMPSVGDSSGHPLNPKLARDL